MPVIEAPSNVSRRVISWLDRHTVMDLQASPYWVRAAGSMPCSASRIQACRAETCTIFPSIPSAQDIIPKKKKKKKKK